MSDQGHQQSVWGRVKGKTERLLNRESKQNAKGKKSGSDSPKTASLAASRPSTCIENTKDPTQAVMQSDNSQLTDLKSLRNLAPLLEVQPSISRSSNSHTSLSIRNEAELAHVSSLPLLPSPPSALNPSQAPQCEDIMHIEPSGPFTTGNADVNTPHPPPRHLTTLGAEEPIATISITQLPDLAEVPPIHELWNEAYDELKVLEMTLMQKYERILGDQLSTLGGSTVSSLGFKIQRQEHMANLLQKKIEQAEKDTWKLKFGAAEFAVKDLAQPVVSVIKWANDYISSALASNPYTSIAWSGVSLLLPLALNPSKQAVSLTKGLSAMADLIMLSKMREDLYERCYTKDSKDDRQKPFSAAHILYRDALKALYIQILKYQVSVICYLSEKDAFRLGLAMIKWNDWDSGLNDIQTQERAFEQVYKTWRDVRYEEESAALRTRHEENIVHLEMLQARMSGLQEAVKNASNDAQRTALLDWLSNIDPSVNYNNAIEKRKRGSENHTGEWLLKDNKDFDQWQAAPNSLLWLNGKAGSGKSVLCASAVKHLRRKYDSDAETALAQFYFSFADTKKQNVSGMLSSVIKQLCCQRPDTPTSVGALVDYRTKGERPDIEALEKGLLATMHGFTHVYVLIDALDECPSTDNERHELLTCLIQLRQHAPSSLHLFLTSRREFDIEAELQVATSVQDYSPIIDINLSTIEDAVNRDIGQYIDQTFTEHPFCSWKEDMKEEAKATLISKAQGMFQYVSCQFDALRNHKGHGNIRKALEGLPNGLDETYERILEAIDPTYRKQVASTLKWLTYSVHPLSVEQLAEIFILDPDQSPPFDEENRLDPAELVLSYLPGLVVKEIQSFFIGDVICIRFAHFSVQEYLSSERATRTQPLFSTRDHDSSHLHIAESCLAYHLQLSDTILATDEVLRQYRLWEYAARQGLRHLENLPCKAWTTSITDRAMRSLAAESPAFKNLSRINDFDRGAKFRGLETPLHHAIDHNYTQLASHLVENGANINEVPADTYCATPLEKAAERGQIDIVQLLLDYGADTNMGRGGYGSALQAAAVRRDIDIVQLLLDHGADVNIGGGLFSSALQAAAASGKIDIVQLLLDYGADVNIGGGVYSSVLQAAAASGKIDIVQLLLDYGADVNIGGGVYSSVLQAAAASGKIDIVQLLLEHGADTNIGGRGYSSALEAAAASGNIDIVQLLLDHGADINLGGGEYGSALQAAAISGNIDIVQLLLEPDRGTEVNLKGGIYGNALQAAVASHPRENLECAKLLLSRGAEVDPPGEEWEALMARIEDEDSRNVTRLRKFQKDPSGYVERWEQKLAVTGESNGDDIGDSD